MPIYEKENAFEYFGEYDQVAIVDSDIYIKPNAPDIFLDLLTQQVKIDLTHKYQWMSEESLLNRLDLIYQWMQDEQVRSTLAKDIEIRTKLRVDGSRRDFYLRQQLKTIQQELGDSEEPQVEADLYQEKLDDSNIFFTARKVFNAKQRKLDGSNTFCRQIFVRHKSRCMVI